MEIIIQYKCSKCGLIFSGFCKKERCKSHEENCGKNDMKAYTITSEQLEEMRRKEAEEDAKVINQWGESWNT